MPVLFWCGHLGKHKEVQTYNGKRWILLVMLINIIYEADSSNAN